MNMEIQKHIKTQKYVCVFECVCIHVKMYTIRYWTAPKKDEVLSFAAKWTGRQHAMWNMPDTERRQIPHTLLYVVVKTKE